MKTRLIIVYTEMIVGGATTSLLGLLNALPREKYDISLLLYENGGPRQGEIPSGVRVLPQAKVHQSHGVGNLARKALSPRYMAQRLRARFYQRKIGNPLVATQILSRQGARYSRRLNGEYDVCVSYLEFWPLNYGAFHVRAKRKLAWIHVDYGVSGMLPALDAKAFSRVDRIVLVSEECLTHFRTLCPAYADKAIYLPNLLSRKMVLAAATAETVSLPFKRQDGDLTLGTVCRVSFRHKGLDRGVEAFSMLKARHRLGNLRWLIVGDGEDMPRLTEMIRRAGLEDHIFPIGAKLRPLPYLLACDAFLLPSRFEGKPMAVTEAMLLGVPPIVTDYASAAEQIEDGVDGLILPNTDSAVGEGLLRVLDDTTLLGRLRENLRGRSYEQTNDVRRILDAIDGKDKP